MLEALLLALVLESPAAPVVRGLYFEQTTLVREPGTTAAPGVRSRVWCTGSRMRLEAADAPAGPALVLRLDEGRVLRLDPEARLATELDSARLRSRSQSDAALAAGLLTTPGAELRTRPLEAQRTIAGRLCRGFRISGSTAVVEVWVAEGLPIGPELFAAFLDWSGAAQVLSGYLDAVRALPGFPLETRLRVSVLGTPQETISTITALRVLAIPAERFEVPPGWRTVKERSSEEVPR